MESRGKPYSPFQSASLLSYGAFAARLSLARAGEVRDYLIFERHVPARFIVTLGRQQGVSAFGSPAENRVVTVKVFRTAPALKEKNYVRVAAVQCRDKSKSLLDRRMTSFTNWCTEVESKHARNTVVVLSADEGKLGDAKALVAGALSDFYVDPVRKADMLEKLNHSEVAKYVADKLPLTLKIRSGDLGEVLCNAYIFERTPFKQGIHRLRWKDSRDMAMRGEDALAFNFGDAGVLEILKAESKSAAKMSSTTIGKARKALCAYSGLPGPHALSFVADRLKEKDANDALADAIDLALLVTGIKPAQVTHLLFTFSGNAPDTMLTTNLTGYKGKFKQRYVGLRVQQHQKFIKDVFDSVAK